MLGTEEGIQKFLSVLSNEEDRREIKTLFNKENTSEARWNIFVAYIESKRTAVFMLYIAIMSHFRIQNIISYSSYMYIYF